MLVIIMIHSFLHQQFLFKIYYKYYFFIIFLALSFFHLNLIKFNLMNSFHLNSFLFCLFIFLNLTKQPNLIESKPFVDRPGSAARHPGSPEPAERAR